MPEKDNRYPQLHGMARNRIRIQHMINRWIHDQIMTESGLKKERVPPDLHRKGTERMDYKNRVC